MICQKNMVMKNILVPTNFDTDTIHAMKIASDFKRSDQVHVKLFSTSAISDSITELLFSSQWKEFNPASRAELLKSWEAHRLEHQLTHIKISECHQYDMSRPILVNLLERFAIDMVIVPFSFQQSKQYIERLLLLFLCECKLPLMLLPNETEHPGIYRALYLDENKAMPTAVLQSFPFHVIHQSMIKSGGLHSIKAMILNFRINLIVLTKGTERILGQPISDFGLPVLTI